MKYCKKCGTANLRDSLMCSFCGAMLPLDTGYTNLATIFKQPEDTEPASPVDVIDRFLAERNHRRITYIFAFSIVFLILMTIAVIGCALLLIRHSSLWIVTDRAGILIDDVIVRLSFFAISALTAVMFALSIPLLTLSVSLKKNFKKPAHTRLLLSNSINTICSMLMILFSICLLLETFLLVYVIFRSALVSSAGGYAELTICLLRFGTDLIFCPVLLFMRQSIRRYKHTLKSLPVN